MANVTAIGNHFNYVEPTYDASMAACGWAVNDYLGVQLTDPSLKLSRVLDLGSGTGNTLEVVLRCTDPDHADAVDVSENMAAHLRARFEDPRVVVTRMAVDAFLAESDEPYNLITGMGVWQFSSPSEQRGLTQAAAGRLAGQGRLMFTYGPLLPDQLHESPTVPYGDLDGRVFIHRRRPEEVAQDVRDSGLHLIKNEIISSQPLRDMRIKSGFVVAVRP